MDNTSTKPLAPSTLFAVSIIADCACKVSFTSRTAGRAIADANREALYYALVCGYRDVRVDPIDEVCATCYGDGEVAKGLRRVRCRECRGKGRRQAIPGWGLLLPDDVASRRDAMTSIIGVVLPA